VVLVGLLVSPVFVEPGVRAAPTGTGRATFLLRNRAGIRGGSGSPRRARGRARVRDALQRRGAHFWRHSVLAGARRRAFVAYLASAVCR
jgi:hypothetical protein